MMIGYARVSTPAQSLDRQILALEHTGCTAIFAETASGKGGNMKARPELQKAIAALRPGDTLVLAEWDRATRSLQDGVLIMAQVHGKAASLKALDRAWLDLSTPIGKGIMAFLSALAEDERERIVKRGNDGRLAAVARGEIMGRKPKLTTHQRREARVRLDAGESCASIARTFNVHKSTIARLAHSEAP